MANHPIFTAAFHGDANTVSHLLTEDPELIAIRDAKDLTPLHVAASRGQTGVVKILLECGADVHGPTGDGEWTPLVFAAYRGHYDVAKVLVENGAGVTSTDGNPIHYAGQRRHKEICRLLVQHGAIDDLLVTDDVDVANLFRAAYSYDADTVKEILSRRPELVHSKDQNDRTPLHEACTHGDTKTVRALMKYGADAMAHDTNQQTPADRAKSHNQRAVTQLLEKHVAK